MNRIKPAANIATLLAASALLALPAASVAQPLTEQSADAHSIQRSAVKTGVGPILSRAATRALSVNQWSVYDATPPKVAIASFNDPERGEVILLAGAGMKNGYRLDRLASGSWADNENMVLQWTAKYEEFFTVYVSVETNDGNYLIYYSPVDEDKGVTGNYLHRPLGQSAGSGKWQTFTRDLAADLAAHKPELELLGINAFLVRGTGFIADVTTLEGFPTDLDSDSDGLSDKDELEVYNTNPYHPDSDGDDIGDGNEVQLWGDSWSGDIDGDSIVNLLDVDADGDGLSDGAEQAAGSDPADGQDVADSVVYEAGETNPLQRWKIYDDSPAGAAVSISQRGEGDTALSLSSSKMYNGFQLLTKGGNLWRNGAHGYVQWMMQTGEDYRVYLLLDTEQGRRYLAYSGEGESRLGDDKYIHIGLGVNSKNTNWQTFTRDVHRDLQLAQPGNQLLAIDGMLVRGSMALDNVKTLTEIDPSLDSDGDGLTDAEEWDTYGTDPGKADSDGDGINDLVEFELLGDNWNEDSDGDGKINILDSDSDNDGISDGSEVMARTDMLDASSLLELVAYGVEVPGAFGTESTLLGWDVYDNTPAGASMELTEGFEGQRAVKFNGDGQRNGFRLRDANGNWWNNTRHSQIRWDMLFDQPYTVYVAAQTKDGFRYFYYTSADHDLLGDGQYIHFGLGEGTLDGSWAFVRRNLATDLKRAQPDNELTAILGILVRGSGQMKGVATFSGR